jgi:Tfp pilus assembly protein PilO
MMLLIQTPAPTPPPDVVIGQFPPFPVAGPTPPWESLPPGVFLLICLAFVGGFVAVFWPLMRAIARRIEGKARPDTALLEEIDHLRSRIGDLETMQMRMTELEERVDFTERLLAQKSDLRELGR